ncbi:MAG: hypothetical protein NVS9B4_23370 [Candidatus Acidiferrum sp.]
MQSLRISTFAKYWPNNALQPTVLPPLRYGRAVGRNSGFIAYSVGRGSRITLSVNPTYAGYAGFYLVFSSLAVVTGSRLWSPIGP